MMHFGHEGMEMHPAFVFYRCAGEKQIHHHGFATPDTAMDVEAMRFGQGRLVALEQTESRRFMRPFWGPPAKRAMQRIQPRRHFRLHGVRLDASFRNQDFQPPPRPRDRHTVGDCFVQNAPRYKLDA